MIRKYRLEDLDDIMELEEGAFPKTAYGRNIFMEWSQQMPDTFLVYTDGSNEKAVGYILFWPNGHIASIAVQEDMRKNGIGTELVEKALCFSDGVARIEVRAGNLGALEFYKKIGFVQTDVVTGYYPEEKAIIMVRMDR